MDRALARISKCGRHVRSSGPILTVHGPVGTGTVVILPDNYQLFAYGGVTYWAPYQTADHRTVGIPAVNSLKTCVVVAFKNLNFSV